MNIAKAIPGKLLCSMGYHKLVTIQEVRSVLGPRDLFVEVRKCSRCGFSYIADVRGR